MEIRRAAQAGTLESCDAAVTVEPLGPGAPAALEVLVEGGDRRFEPRVRAAALAALAELGVAAAKVTVRDRSALDCTVRARVLAACLRAAGDEPLKPATAPWEALI